METSKDSIVIEELKKIDGIVDAYFVFGPYDAYAFIEAESLDVLNELVMNKIRNVQGVKSTVTCFLAE